MTDSKESLKRYCRQGNVSALNSFYHQQASRLWRFLRTRGCSEDDAYDILKKPNSLVGDFDFSRRLYIRFLEREEF